MFENIAANLLNKFLGDFVDNLDASQLNIGIYGGDVKLKNLKIKDTALDGLNLPVKLKYGVLSSLVLKVPWTNLFSEPVLCEIEGLCLIIVPNQGIVYNEENAKKEEVNFKRKTLNALEEQRQQKRKPKTDQPDTFTEKIVSQIIKNLQIEIRSIHIRYEDKFSNKDRPFAAGITLESFYFKTTDENYVPKIHKGEMKYFYKIISLNNFSIYWNSNAEFYSDIKNEEEIYSVLKETIATSSKKPDNFKYMFGPFLLSAKLRLNPKPEAERFKVPKVNLIVETDVVALYLDKYQYQDLLYFLGSLDRFKLSFQYTKFRPNLTQYRGHCKEWWRFAYNCVLDDVRRRRRNWSWEHIKAHRKMCRSYLKAWIHFRTNKNCDPVFKKSVDEAEAVLDVFNLNITRQQAETEIDQLGLLRTEDHEPEGWGAWAKGWLGGGSSESQKSNDATPALTEEQRKELYKAIDYQEDVPPTNYPKEYVENRLKIKTSMVSISVGSALDFNFIDLTADFDQRPSARAMSLKASIKSLSMKSGDFSMVELIDDFSEWLNMEYVTNPLDGSFDQMIGMKTSPIQLKYHTPMVNAFLDVFRPPESIRLEQLFSLAMMRYEAVKMRSVTGLQYAIDKNVRIKMAVSFSPITIILSKGGSFDEQQPTLIAQLAQLNINTVEEPKDFTFLLDELVDEKGKEVFAKAYLNIRMEIFGFSLCFEDSYEKCMLAHESKLSEAHVLKPTGLTINMCKAMVDDPQLPKFRMHSVLENIALSISDTRLTKLLDFALTFPVPSAGEEPAPQIVLEPSDENRVTVLNNYSVDSPKKEQPCDQPDSSSTNAPKLAVFEFKIDEIAASLFSNRLQRYSVDDDSTAQLPFAALNIQSFDMSGSVGACGELQTKMVLRSIGVDDLREGVQLRHMLGKKNCSSLTLDEDQPLVDFSYAQDAKGSKTVNFNSSSIYLILSPEFLNALATFVVFPPLDAAAKSTQSVSRTKNEEVKAAAPPPPPVATARKPLESSPSLNCRIQGIEIILLENSLNVDNSRALIFSFNSFLDVKTENDVIQMKGGIRQLNITSTFFAESKRDQLSYSVLHRVDINLNGAITVNGQKFVVYAKKIHFRISPPIINLLSNVSSQLTAKTEDSLTKTTSNTSGVMPKAYPNYWTAKDINKGMYWWFKESKHDAEAVTSGYVPPVKKITSASSVVTEELLCQIDSFVVAVESGCDYSTMPVIHLESSLESMVRNWSSALIVDSTLRLQVSYYNEIFSVWEPVLEPVLNKENGQWRSWELVLQVSKNLEEMNMMGDALPPKTIVSVKANEMMNITITKTFLQLTNKLLMEFEQAANKLAPPKRRELPGDSSCLVYNESGLQISVLSSETLRVSDSDLDKPLALPQCEFVSLIWDNDETQAAAIQLSDVDQRRCELRLQLMGTTREVNVMRAEKRCVQLPKETDCSGKTSKLLVDTRLENYRHVVYLRSLVNFVNHLDENIEVFAAGMVKSQISSCGVIKKNADPLYVPLELLYSATGEFSFRLTNDKYEISTETICWHDFDEKKRAVVRCDLSEDLTKGFYIDTVVETENVMGEKGKHFVDKLYTVHLCPPLHLNNYIPLPLKISKPVELTLDGGQGSALNLIPGLPLEFSFEYSGTVYSKTFVIAKNPADLEVVSMESADGKKSFQIGLNWSTQSRQLELNVFVRHWMVNNTSRKLRYMESNSNRPINNLCSCTFFYGGKMLSEELAQEGSDEVLHSEAQNPVLLSLSAKDFFGNKKAKLCLEDSNWSKEFPLDTAGNAGRVTCSSRLGKQDYELSVDVQLCQFGLSKVITISPFYLVQNDSKFNIEICEDTSAEWLLIPAESCVALWPTQQSKRKMMRARYSGQTESSILFPFTETFEGFCKINNEYIGVYVTCSVGESSSVVRVESFVPGMVPAIFMNASSYPVEFGQCGIGEKERLEPGKLKAFTWSSVTESVVLEWKSGDDTARDELVRNAIGNYSPVKSSGKFFYWVSFLEGRQRFFLFTEYLEMAVAAHGAYEMERADLQAELSLFGIGVSLVNNLDGNEVLYMAIMNSGILWEEKLRRRFRPLSVKEMVECESKYTEWLSAGQPEGFQSTEAFELDFKNMLVRRKGKSKSETTIRRCFLDGLWTQYRSTPHQTQLHLKLSHLQIDNQLPSSTFPCALSIVPQPKSLVADNAPKPFTEFSFVMSHSEHSKVAQIKYLHLLVQEFAIRIDSALINAILELFATESSAATDFNKDLALTRPLLSQRVLHTTNVQLKTFYDDLHISPLMIHLSLSLIGGSTGKKQQGGIHSEFFNVVMKSIGLTLTELQDVVFKLAYFERRHVFYNRKELESEIMSHYTFQFIKQLYVLVLGLDIMGNPFGLVRDLSSGVEDFFYQPIQGAIQGPEEFAEGLALGVQSLFGHALGGAAGAVSRITGTLGKGIAALTFDEDYQRKRQEALNRRPQNVGEGLTRGAKGVGQGVYDGVTGVFLKPIEGAREGGFGGFARGFGKGIVGVVARPVSGVVDFASGTMGALKSIATNSEEAKCIRPPRMIVEDQIIRPYSYEDAIGYKIFRDTDHGKYVNTDQFICYALLSDKFAFIVTDQRIMLSKHQDLIGNWTTDFALTYAEISEPKRTEHGNGIKIELKQKKKGLLGLGSSSGKAIQFQNAEVTERIFNRLKAAYEMQG